MVSTLQWVLLGIGAYWLVILWLRRQGLFPEYIGTQGPIITVHTRRFRSLIDRIARPKRAWRAWGNFGVGVAFVTIVASFAFLAFAAISTINNPPPQTAVNQPRNVLVIPGVNDFLPLSVAGEIIIGLLVGLVVHEGGHGIFCRVGDIDIDSMGIALFAIIPIGAFVEPDEESRKRANRGDQTRMFAAGVMNNFAITIVAFVLLFGPVAGSIGVASGAAVGGVLPGSAAAEADIGQGDRIIAVDGEPVANNSELDATLSAEEDREVPVTIAAGDTEKETTVRRSLLVTGTVANTPLGAAIETGETISAVNGTTVHTEPGFTRELQDRSVAVIETSGDKTVRAPIGAAVVIRSNGPAAAAGLPGGTPAVITAIDERRVASAEDLDRVMETTNSGDTVAIEYYVDGERRVGSVTLGEHPSAPHGFIGVDVAPGISGIMVSDFGTRLYPADLYLALLGGGDGGSGPANSFVGRVVIALQMPLASVATAGLPFNFAGFTGGIENFYVVEGPLSMLGGFLFILANILFWTGWINLNLGVFNCIPAFPLDGGHMLRMATESVVARIPYTSEYRRELTRAVTTGIGLIMLASLLLTIFGPQLLT